MSVYAWRGLDAAGRPVRGARDAADVATLRDALVAERVTPTAIAARGWSWLPSAKSGRLSEAAAGAFTADLARFIKSGLSLGQALQIIEQTAEDKAAVALAGRLRSDLLEGLPLSAGFAAIPGQTGLYLQALGRAGEATGKLADILAGGAAALRSSAALKQRLLTLSVYPLFVLAMAVAAIGVFAFAVLPALEPAFNGVSVQLPAGTRFVLAASRALRMGAPLIGAGLAGAVLAFAGLPRLRGSALELGQRLLLSPLGGGVLQQAVFASLAQRLAIAAGAGVPIAAAFRVSVAAIGVRRIRETLEAQEPRLREGARLSDVLAAVPSTPALLLGLVKVGEASSDLPTALREAGETLGVRANEKTERALALATPAIVLAIGLVVGGIVLTVFQGLLSISQSVDL